MKKTLILTILTLASASAITQVEAANTWSLTRSNHNCVANCGNIDSNNWTNYGDTVTFGSTAGTPTVDVDITAWTNGTGQNGTSGTLQGAKMKLYSGGMGVHTSGEQYYAPNHAFDNSDGFETILLDFGPNNEVSLNEICIGYGSAEGYDTDLSIAAFTGNGPVDLTGASYDTLLSNGWTDIAQLANLQNYNMYNFNGGGTKSRYWLIGAYNPALDSASQGWSTGNDFFKLEFVGGDVFDCPPGSTQNGCGGNGGPGGNVPVPGSLFLMGMGLLLTGASRRYRKP